MFLIIYDLYMKSDFSEIIRKSIMFHNIIFLLIIQAIFANLLNFFYVFEHAVVFYTPSAPVLSSPSVTPPSVS